MIRIGMVDFDTSHVVAFTQRLNHVDIGPEHHIAGDAKVVAGCPGSSDIMPERIPGYVEQMKGYGVPLVERPEDLLGQIDAVMVESQQGSKHLERARPFLEAGLPTFIDKPFAGSLAQADEIISLARKHGAPLMSCSPLRYAPEVLEAQAKQETNGRLLTADVWSTAILHEGNPGLQHYGIHGVEMLFALMGPGCVEARTAFQPGGEVVTGRWSDGRLGVMRGLRDGQGGFGFAAHYEKGHHVATIQGAAYYTEMIKRIVAMFATREEPIALAETREIAAFMDAALTSAQRDGAPVALPAAA
ncbi:MAG TPA: Gfo/Idh/MocA family oxidoreductase [Armatimonadaceae bacterium]|nr:Gfo/Idh/MocA family oxidoreductase [Armatimonadaceae bacterium]